MKEKAPREPLSGRKAAVAARAPGTPAGPQPADALQHSPVLSAQGKRMAQLLERGRRPVQRVKSRPDEKQLHKLLQGLVSKEKGSCCGAAIEVYRKLRDTVDDAGDLQAVLLTWAENAGTKKFAMGNHTAVLASWAEGEFIVDTTAGQFGGPEFYMGPLDDWVEQIKGLQENVSHFQQEKFPKTLSDSRMVARTENRSFDIQQEVKKKKCFLTSACMDYAGLPDDCRELTVLRAFRDGWMQALPEGPALIEEYYAIAPALVDAIDASPARDAFYARILATVRGCVLHIERGRMRPALQAYIDMVRTLQSELRATPATA